MVDNETIAHMASRVEQCRRLAKSTTDKRTRQVLLQMAQEGEADIARMLTESGQSEA